MTDFKKIKLVVSDDKLLHVDPRQLVLASTEKPPTFPEGNPTFTAGFDQTHPSYRESADEQVSLQTAEAAATFGFVGGAIEAHKVGEAGVVTDGRRRTRHFALANELQAPDRDAKVIAAKWNLPLDEVKAVLKRVPVSETPMLVDVKLTEEDDYDAYLRGTILNHHRGTVNPLQEAREIQRAVELSGKKAPEVLPQIALAYGGGVSVDTLKNRLKLLAAPTEVQDALLAGKITPSDAIRMKHLPPAEQVSKLATIPPKPPAGQRRKQADAAKAKATTASKSPKPRPVAQAKSAPPPPTSTGARKPTNTMVVQVLDEIEDKSPAHYALRWREGLIGIATAAAHIGLSKESPVYRHLKDRENAQKDGA